MHFEQFRLRLVEEFPCFVINVVYVYFMPVFRHYIVQLMVKKMFRVGLNWSKLALAFLPETYLALRQFFCVLN